MANLCDNKLLFVSTERGIKDTLRWMVKNLENKGLLDPDDEPNETATLEELYKSIKPIAVGLDCLEALAAEGVLGSDGASFSLSKYDEHTWLLEQSFTTNWAPADFSLKGIESSEPWVTVWKRSDGCSAWDDYSTDIYDSGDPAFGSMTDDDYGFGKPDCYVSDFYRLAGYGELPPNPEKIKYLLKKKRYDEILAMKDDPATREACTHVSPAPFFKKKKMDAYVTLLKMTDGRYHPTKVDEYLDVLVSKKYAEALPVFIKRYAWDKKSAKIAHEFLATKRNGKEALALIDARLVECGVAIPNDDSPARPAAAKGAQRKRKTTAKKKWTKSNAEKFAAMVEGSSVDQLKSFIAESGDGHIPPKSTAWGYGDGDREIIKACMAKPSEAVEKLSYFFAEAGLDMPYLFHFGGIVKCDYEGNLENTPEELEAIKDVFRLLSDKGWTFAVTYSSDLIGAIVAYPKDLEFLKYLSRMGLDFDCTHLYSGNKYVVETLFENSSFDILDFLLEKGLQLTDYGKCTIASNWTEERIDYLISKNQPILLEDFDPGCDLDVYRCAVEKSGMKCKDPESLWSKVINNRRFDIGEYLLQKGITVCSERVWVHRKDIEVIDWALSKGLALRVDISECSRDTLLYAARHGAWPAGSVKIDTKTHQIDARRGEDFFGMKAICELFDTELIKAFLDAGCVGEADASSAVEEGNQELIDLYASHGIDTSLKRVIDGSRYVKDGVARIPEGVEEIAHDAFYGVAFNAIELPSTLKKIGERAFARRQGDPEMERVTVPKSIVSLGLGAFSGFKKISVYDNLDANAKPAHSRIDEGNGEANGSVGWVGIAPWKDYIHCAGNAERTDHEITVLSTETDEVKFRVDMPLESATRDVYCTLASAWGKNVEFDFSVYKIIFKMLPGKESKLKTAINRLTWPIDLDEESHELYQSYVIRNAKDAAALFAKQNDLAGFELLASIGAIKKANIDDMISSAASVGSKDIVKYLECFKAD